MSLMGSMMIAPEEEDISHDAAGIFQDLLREYSMVCSMSRKGNC